MRITFDVFGRLMSVERRENAWLLHQLGADGKRSPMRDVVIPESLRVDELQQYLADVFHEYATERNPEVRRLTGCWRSQNPPPKVYHATWVHLLVRRT